MKNNYSNMTSVKPYLIRAFHEWIVNNELTPYIEVNTKIPMTDVPREYIKNGRIILNIAPSAVKELRLDNEMISFYARFSGVVQHVQVPIRAVLSIYAKENGQGSAFNEIEGEKSDPEVSDSGTSEKLPQDRKQKPILKIVK